MTEGLQEYIDIAAEEARLDYVENDYEPAVGDIPYFFKDGINFFLEKVWHDAEEIPAEGELILVQSLSDPKTVYTAYMSACYLLDSKTDKVIPYIEDNAFKWLYLKDLMK